LFGSVFVSATGLSPEQEPGLFGKPIEAVHVAASIVGAPERPPAAVDQDRLSVFDVALPAAVAGFFYSSHLLVFRFRSVSFVPKMMSDSGASYLRKSDDFSLVGFVDASHT
jgi:hypothetical protein